ncbi:MAG: 8-amino-7-oxononanoate synthase [Myxococcaceae bacterium]
MASLVDTWAAEELSGLARASLRRVLEPLETASGPRVSVNGQTLLNFSSNDYLGLAGAPELREAATRALEAWGVGSGASRLVVGDTGAHHSLERALARFFGTEAAVLFNSGYAANVGVLGSLVGPGDVVFSDELNHASLIDGCRLSRAQVVVFPHRDVEALEALVRVHAGRRRLVVTDAVFSMDGDRAPVRALREVCDRHGLALVVDEAHSTGVLGPGGRGLCALEGVEPEVHVGTLSKALGSFGGFVVGSRALTELLINKARPLVFSTALPAVVCAAAERALELVPERQVALAEVCTAFASSLGVSGSSAIFPVVIGDSELALAASGSLRSAGFLVKAIRPPTVQVGTARLRVALRADHRVDDVLALAASLRVFSSPRPSPPREEREILHEHR